MKTVDSVIKKILFKCNPLISSFEKIFIQKNNQMPLMHQPIFIIGAPRTGSTLLYQILTNSMDITYIDNFIAKFYRNLYFGTYLDQLLFQNKPHNCFRSIHGNTEGARSPNECGEFWYQWLPRDKHFIDHGEIDEASIQEMRKIIFSILNRFKRPLLFKNMNMGLRMRLVSEFAPESKFIFIARNPVDVAVSILEVRKRKYNNHAQWWSLLPNNFKDLLELEPIEQVVKQIFYIEKQIYEDKNIFPDKNFLEISYEELISDPMECVRKIQSSFELEYKLNKGVSDIEITEPEFISLDKATIDSIHKNVLKLDWENYDTI